MLAPDYDTLYEVWRSRVSKIVESEFLESAPNGPKPNQESGIKST